MCVNMHTGQQRENLGWGWWGAARHLSLKIIFFFALRAFGERSWKCGSGKKKKKEKKKVIICHELAHVYVLVRTEKGLAG